MTREPADLNAPELRDRAVRAARGEAPFDLLLTGGQVVDVALGELRAADIGLVGPLIASVHPPGSHAGAAARFDAAGRLIAPGLIDTHLHIESSMVTPRRYAETVVPQGTTTICWDPHEVGNVLGLDGVRWAIEAARDLPLRILVLAPSCVPSAPGLERAGAVFEAAEMREMLAWTRGRGRRRGDGHARRAGTQRPHGGHHRRGARERQARLRPCARALGRRSARVRGGGHRIRPRDHLRR